MMYIVSYMSKAEHEMSEILKQAQRDMSEMNMSKSLEMKKLLQVYMDNREIIAQEAIARVCSLKLKSSSRQVVFIPTDENSTRMSLPLHVIKEQCTDDDTENVWMTNIVDRYKARPLLPIFTDMCLATFASEYRVIYSETSPNNPNVFSLTKQHGCYSKENTQQPCCNQICKVFCDKRC